MSVHEPTRFRSVSLSPCHPGDPHPGGRSVTSKRFKPRPSSHISIAKTSSLGVSRPNMSIVAPPPRAHVRRSDDITSPTSSFRRPIPSPVPPTSPVIYPSPDSPPLVIRTLVQEPRATGPLHHVQRQLRQVSSAVDLQSLSTSQPASRHRHNAYQAPLAPKSRHRPVYTDSNKRVLAPPRHSSQLSPPSSRCSSPQGSPTAPPPRRLSSSSTVHSTPPEPNPVRLSHQRADAGITPTMGSHAHEQSGSRPSSAQYFAPPRPTHHHHRLQSESMIPGYSSTPNGDFIENPDPPQYHHSYQHATYPGAELPTATPTPPPLGSGLHRNNTTPRAYRDSNFSDVASTIAPMGQRSSVLTAGRTGTDGEWLTTTAISGSPSVPLDKLPEDWRASFIPVLVSKQARENLRAALNVFLDEPHVRDNYSVELFVHKDDETVLYVCHRGTRRERLLSDIKKDTKDHGAIVHGNQLPKEPKNRPKVGRPRANTGASTMSFMVTDDFMPQPIPRSCCSQTTHHSLEVLLSDSDASSSAPGSLIHLVPRPISMPLTTQVDKDTKQYLIASFILRPDLHAVCYPTNAPVLLDHEAAPSPLLIPGQPHQPMPVGCTFAPKARDLQVWLRVAVQSMKQNGTWGRIPVDDEDEMNSVCCTIM